MYSKPNDIVTPIIQFGLETEIGIFRDTTEELDVVAESIALVRSATEPGVWMRWDYGSEDPHADVRGFRVRELRQDTDEVLPCFHLFLFQLTLDVLQ